MAGPWESYAQANESAAPWEQYADTGERALPKGVAPSAVDGGRGSAVDPRRTDAPARMPTLATEAPAFSDPSGAGDGAAIMNSGAPARSSVLEGIQMDAPVTNRDENVRLSNRTYAEDSAVARKPGQSASRIDGKTIPVNNSGTLNRAADLVGSQIDSYAAGLGYRAGDAAALVGADKVAANLRGRASNLQERSDTTSQSVSLSADGAFEKYAPQILAVFPTMAVAAASGGLPVMFGVAELQQYAEGRKAGLNPMMALGRSVPMGAAEVIGEKLGGTGKLLEALEKAAVKGGSIESLKELSGRLAASGMREVPSEEATYAMQFGIDKAPGIGLKPEAGVSDFMEGAKDTAIVAAGAGGVMAGASMGASRLARIKQLRDAGETGVADLLQTKHDKQSAVESVDSELAAMPGNPEFQTAYRNMRTAGLKPAEAAGRSAVTVTFQGLAAQTGIPTKAADAALQKASTLPIDQVPGFFAKFTNALAARGLVQPFDGIDTLTGDLETARDEAIDAAMGAAYSQSDVRKSMDDVLALEQKNNVDEPVSSAQAATETIAVNQPQGANEASQAQTVSRETAAPDAVPAGAAAGNAGQPVGSSALLAPGGTEPGPEALNGVLRDTNPQAGTAAQAEAAPGQAAEVGAVEPAGQPAAGDAAGAGSVQANGVVRETTDGERRIASKAESMLDLKESPTGWKRVPIQNGNGVILVSADGKKSVPFISTNLNSGTEGLRQSAMAQAYAIDNPYTIETPTGELISTPIFKGPPAQAEPAPAATETVAPVQLGRNNIPLTEGGKPYKTNIEAKKAKKLQPLMRVVRVEGGFVLAEKTPAQLAAEKVAARRLRSPNTSPAGEAMPAHAFIAAEGGLSPFERADMGMEGNVQIGNRPLFAGTGKGLTIERATEKLVEDGYLPEGAGHNEARALIKRSLTNPQYTPEGTEMMAEKEAAANEAAYYAEQEAIALAQEAEDNQFADAADAYEAAMLDYPADAKQSDLSREDAFLAMGFTEQEYQDAIAQESSGPQSGGQAVPGAAQTTTGARPQGDSGRAPAPNSDAPGRSQEVEQKAAPADELKPDTLKIYPRAPKWTPENPSSGKAETGLGRDAINKVTAPISYDAAKALVAGKTEKPGGVDPVKQIGVSEENDKTLRIGDVPLSMFRENEEGELYDGTVNLARAKEYSQRDAERVPPVIAVLSPKTGKLNILDGGHRLTAARMRGDETIPTIVSLKPEPAITFALRESGSLAVKGNPQAIRDKLKGITKIAPMEGGMMVGKAQAQRAIDILSDKPAEAPAARPLSVGITPATAEAVTVKDGKVFIGPNEAVNFDSGDAVSVKPGATDAQIVQALKDAGALSRRQKVFGLQDAAQNQSAAQENSDKPAPDALKSALSPEPKPERNEALIELRKRESVLKALIKCMGG